MKIDKPTMVLNGIKAIGEYLSVPSAKVLPYVFKYGMPVYRGQGYLYAYKFQLDVWRQVVARMYGLTRIGITATKKDKPTGYCKYNPQDCYILHLPYGQFLKKYPCKHIRYPECKQIARDKTVSYKLDKITAKKSKKS